jgi:chromosome segregation ATPase
MTLKKLATLALGLVCGLGSVYGVLNKDLNPFIRSAKSDMKDRILSLVNQRKLTLERAREAVSAAEHNIIDLHRQKTRLESMHGGLVGKVDETRLAARSCKSELARLQSQLVAGGVVYASTGKAMSRGELGSTIDFQTRELKRIEGREKSLSTLLDACSGQLDRISVACDQAPLKLRSVIAMCSDLESKTQLAVDMQNWSTKMSGELKGSGESLDSVEDSLSKISADLDGEIAGLGTLMQVHSDVRGSGAASTDDLLAKIQSALGEGSSSGELALLK